MSVFSIRKFIDLIVVDDFNRAFVFVFDQKIIDFRKVYKKEYSNIDVLNFLVYL